MITDFARGCNPDGLMPPRLGRLGTPPQAEQLGQAEPQQAREPDLEELAAEDADRMAVCRRHERSSPSRRSAATPARRSRRTGRDDVKLISNNRRQAR